MNKSNKISAVELQERLAWPLDRKIEETWHRMEVWYNAFRFDGGVRVSFSGGLDSTVLLHLVRMNPFLKDANIPAVFFDTGLEFPEIRAFVKATPNVVIMRPKMTFPQVVAKYGYPVVSKRVAQYVNEVRHSRGETATKRLRLFGGTRPNGLRDHMGMISLKWQFLCSAPFEVGEKCCKIMKKNPADEADRLYGKPMIGVRADEGQQRSLTYQQFGCNAFDLARPRSTPIAFWTHADILAYIKEFNVPYSPIYDMGYKRTGCMFCMFGLHLEKRPNRFDLMQKTHPKIYDYCMNELGLGSVIEFVDYGQKPQKEKERIAAELAQGRLL